MIAANCDVRTTTVSTATTAVRARTRRKGGRGWSLAAAALTGALITLLVLHLRDGGFWAQNGIEVQGVSALASVVVTFALVSLTARYVRLTRELSTTAADQLSALREATAAAQAANTIAADAIAEDKAHFETQMRLTTAAYHADTRARLAAAAPMVTVENVDQALTCESGLGPHAAAALKKVPVVLRIAFVIQNHGPGPASINLPDLPFGRWVPDGTLPQVPGSPAQEAPAITERILPVNGEWCAGWIYAGSLDTVMRYRPGEDHFALHFSSQGTLSPVIDTHSWLDVQARGLPADGNVAAVIQEPLLGLKRVGFDERQYPPEAQGPEPE